MNKAVKTSAKRMINIATILGGLWSLIFIPLVGLGNSEYLGEVIVVSLGIFLAIGVINYFIFGEVSLWHNKESFD